MPDKVKRPPSATALSNQNVTKASKTAPSLTEEEEKALQQKDNVSLQKQFEEATANSE